MQKADARRFCQEIPLRQHKFSRFFGAHESKLYILQTYRRNHPGEIRP